MDQRIALITGANKGIGFEAARGLGGRGVRVLVGARSSERGEAAAEALRSEGADAEFVLLDVADQDSVRAAAKEVEDRYGRLDILVNNAGIALADGDWNTSELTLETARKVFEVNFFGVVAMTNAFLPLLRRSGQARIVNVSSEVGSMDVMLRTDLHPAMVALQPSAYGASKAALNSLTVSYAKELRGTPIKVNAVTPGYTATDLNGNQGWRKVEDGAKVVVDTALLGPDGPSGTFRSDGRLDFLDGEIVPW